MIYWDSAHQSFSEIAKISHKQFMKLFVDLCRKYISDIRGTCGVEAGRIQLHTKRFFPKLRNK